MQVFLDHLKDFITHFLFTLFWKTCKYVIMYNSFLESSELCVLDYLFSIGAHAHIIT